MRPIENKQFSYNRTNINTFFGVGMIIGTLVLKRSHQEFKLFIGYNELSYLYFNVFICFSDFEYILIQIIAFHIMLWIDLIWNMFKNKINKTKIIILNSYHLFALKQENWPVEACEMLVVAETWLLDQVQTF